MQALLNVVSVVFWGVVLLSVLVFVHEGGHFLASRALGMRATEFFLGLPSNVKLSRKSKKLGTEFGVTPILLGGYTMICGMEGVEDELLAQALQVVTERGSINSLELAEELGCDEERAWRMLATLADWASVRRVTFDDGTERYLTMRRDANLLTEYDRGHDFEAEGTTEEGEPRETGLTADEFLAQERSHTFAGHGFWHRVIVLLAGPLVNILLAVVVYVLLFSAAGVTFYNPYSNAIGSVESDSLAAMAGLEKGDKLVSIAGVEVNDWYDISNRLDEVLARGEDFEVVYVRDGASTTVLVDQDEANPSDVFGITVAKEVKRVSVADSLSGAFSYAWQVASFAVQLIMPTHTVATLEQTSSVIGISIIASQAASTGIRDFMLIMVAVSMSLGFMNLLPIPPLDGGKILVELIQLIIRRPLSRRVQNAISYVGLAFFLAIFVVAVKNDVITYLIG